MVDRRASPLHGRTTAHAADMAAIEQSSQPMSTAEKLVAQRISEITESKIEAMLREHQGRRKRYTYNQAAVIGIEHLVAGPLDPQTQHPIWQDMLRKTKGGTMPKAEYMAGARAILCQHSQYDPQTMAG